MADTYNPKNVHLIYGGASIEGYAEGSYINVEFNNDQVALLVGADGKGTRSIVCDNSATITVRLLPTSTSNAVFQAARSADAAAGAGSLPLLLTNTETGQVYTTEGAWVQKQPGYDFQVEAQAVEWILETDNLVAAQTGL